MAKLKLLGNYDINKGIDIVLGRKKDIPEGVSFGNDLILVGDCTNFLKKKIEEAGESCIHVAGCPPGEPLPYWGITDRVTQPDPKLLANPVAIRERLREETDILLENLKETQNC